MNTRRGFLATLIGAAVLDPERLLWVPGKKMISIPKSVAEPTNLEIWQIVTTPIEFTFEWQGVGGVPEELKQGLDMWIYQSSGGRIRSRTAWREVSDAGNDRIG